MLETQLQYPEGHLTWVDTFPFGWLKTYNDSSTCSIALFDGRSELAILRWRQYRRFTTVLQKKWQCLLLPISNHHQEYNVTQAGHTPLHLTSTRAGNTASSAAERMMEQGANVNAVDHVSEAMHVVMFVHGTLSCVTSTMWCDVICKYGPTTWIFAEHPLNKLIQV